MASRMSETETIPQISTSHQVSAAEAEYAREKIGHALDHAPEPVQSARVRMTGHRDPAVAKPVVAQVNVNMPGRAVRAQVAAETPREAVDLLEARLRARFERLSRHWEALRGGRAKFEAHEWRHGGPVRDRLPYYPRRLEQREVVRRKSYALADETCDEAAFDMEMMDYDFQLFTETGTGLDSVLYRTDGGEYRLAQTDPHPEAVALAAVPFTVSAAPAPELDLGNATVRLELTRWPFVFFRDRDTGRGSVLYHRYDGHYGLITPAA